MPEWSCKECGYSPDWEELYSRDDYYPCNWCGKNISDDHTTVVHCRDCTRESQKRAEMRRNQCCPHCGEILSADDLRKIKEARRKARQKYEEKVKNTRD